MSLNEQMRSLQETIVRVGRSDRSMAIDAKVSKTMVRNYRLGVWPMRHLASLDALCRLVGVKITLGAGRGV